MPIGLNIGVRIGAQIGVGVGLIPSAANPLASVTRDATSLIYCPANATEAATFMTAAGLTQTINSIHNCQEASGNMLDAVDTVNLVVAGSPTRQQAFAGWTRKSTNITATTVQAFSAAIGVGPNPAAESVAWFGWLATTATPGGNRTVICISNDGGGSMMVSKNAANKLVLTCGGSTTTSVQSYTLATAYPIGLVYDRTHSTFTLYTNLEVLTCTFGAIADGAKGIGAVVGNGDPSAKYLYMFQLRGANAELSTANVRALYQTAGWGTMPW